MIPKHVYQTWKVGESGLAKEIVAYRKQMKKDNPDYVFHLYDDLEAEKFILNYTADLDDNEDLLEIYRALGVGAARADFWRYLILYKLGGVYLDMDAGFIMPIDEIITRVKVGAAMNGIRWGGGCHKVGLITRECNEGVFNNWIMMFEPGHPFMRLMIDYCIYHIRARSCDNVLALTGPLGLSAMLGRYLGIGIGELGEEDDELIKVDMTRVSEWGSYGSRELYKMSDADFNRAYSVGPWGLFVNGMDMNGGAVFKHPWADRLYNSACIPWRATIGGGSAASAQIWAKKI